MNRSESISSIAKALSQFQNEVVQPEKSASNPHFKSKYVPLDNVVKSIADTAPKYGLSYIQTSVTESEKAGVQTLLMHESGEWMEFEPFLLPIGQKSTPQAVGSAITYARRYTLSSIFGIASETDDDGNTASDNAKNNPSTNAPVMASTDQIKTLGKMVTTLAGVLGVDAKELSSKYNLSQKMTLEDAKISMARLKDAVEFNTPKQEDTEPGDGIPHEDQ